MSWGYQQGCAYVTSRCGIGANDRSASPASSSECGGDPAWASADAYLAAKCAGGTTPCATLVSSGWSSSGGSGGGPVCNAQCYTVTSGRSDCTLAPVAPVDSAGKSELFGIELKEEWLQWLILGAWGLGLLAFLGFWRECFCPKRGSPRLIVAISILLGTFGVLLLTFACYCIYYSFSSLHGHIEGVVATYVGRTTLYVSAAVGGFLGLLALLTFFGLCCRSPRALCAAIGTYLVVILAQIALTVLVLLWINNLDAISADSLEALRGDSNGLHAGKFGAEALSEAEGITCRTYQTCCRDPGLDLGNSGGANATCRTAHEGTATAIALALEDPSNPDFCPFVSGARLNFSPAQGVCNLLEIAVSELSLPDCQADFCPTGIDGCACAHQPDAWKCGAAGAGKPVRESRCGASLPSPPAETPSGHSPPLE